MSTDQVVVLLVAGPIFLLYLYAYIREGVRQQRAWDRWEREAWEIEALEEMWERDLDD